MALRWYSKASNETEPIDEFLKVWFALEILAMPDRGNLKQVEDILAAIYGKTREEVKVTFRVGRLLGLRGEIAHNGKIPSIHGQLQKYVEAIFVDVLFHIIGQTSEKRTEKVLSDTTFPVKTWRL